jgi:hypothetical protein
MTIENRTLSDFSQIVLEGNGELILVHGDSPAVVIETDPETLEHIKTEVVDGKLILGMKSWLDAILHGWKRHLHRDLPPVGKCLHLRLGQGSRRAVGIQPVSLHGEWFRFADRRNAHGY